MQFPEERLSEIPIKTITHLLATAVVTACLLACSETEKAQTFSSPPSPGNPVKSTSSDQATDIANITDNDFINADRTPGNWLTHGGNHREERYSQLDQIRPDNVHQLGLAWTLDLGTKRGIQATPIVANGIMYLSGPWSVVWAIDTRKGEIIWKYDPQVPRDIAAKLCCGVINRGVALYQEDIFLGTLDGRLVSLDAATGKPNWQTMTVPEGAFYSSTGAPRIVKGNVVIGNAGADFNARGYVTAYHAKTGEQVWRFYTVPGNPDKPFEHPDLAAAAETWTGEWWKQGGGGTVWDAIVYDPDLNLIYIGVGNGTHMNRKIRSPEGGDNLYLSSIVALDADSGEYRWHFQTTPGESWDYTAAQHIILADLDIEGETRKVLMQAPKNGFFYVIDRTNGEFISGKNFVYTNWASGLDDNGRPIETENARYSDGKAHWLAPSQHGGHNWTPMSFSRQTGLVYIPAAIESGLFVYDDSIDYGSEKDLLHQRLGVNVSFNGKLYNPPVIDPNAPPPGYTAGKLIAWDPIQQREVWHIDQKLHYNGGLLSTASGLLMQGDAEGIFSIRDAASGDVLWDFDIRTGAIAPPVTYQVDGEQYISLAVGWGGSQGLKYNTSGQQHSGTLYTWKLGGTAAAPERTPVVEKPFTTASTQASDIEIGKGATVWLTTCLACHALGTGDAVAPDLTRSHAGIFDIFDQIVGGGILASQGMPGFGDKLSAEDIDHVKAYILYLAQQLRDGKDPAETMGNIVQMQIKADQAQP